MDETTWDSLAIEVNEYLEAATDLNDGLRKIVTLNLEIGNQNPEERDGCAGALKELLRGRPGTPFRKGKKSSVPASVRVSVDRICNVVSEASLAYYNHDAIIGQVTFARGGALFETAEEYAANVVKRTRSALSKLYKSGEWDGSIDSLLPSEEGEESED